MFGTTAIEESNFYADKPDHDCSDDSTNKVYGDSKLWNQIYETNKSTIGSDPAALKVGMKLQIPAKSGAPGKTEAKEPSKSSATTGASTPSAPR